MKIIRPKYKNTREILKQIFFHLFVLNIQIAFVRQITADYWLIIAS